MCLSKTKVLDNRVFKHFLYPARVKLLFKLLKIVC